MLKHISVSELSQSDTEHLEVGRVERGGSRLQHADPVELPGRLRLGCERGENEKDRQGERDRPHIAGESSRRIGSADQMTARFARSAICSFV